MIYCSNCIHYKVCGNEGVDDSAMTFCADKQTDGDLISKDKLLSGIYSENPEDVMKYIADFPSVQPKSVPIAVIKLDADEIVQKLLDEIQPSGDLISRIEKLHTIESTDGQEYYQAYDVLRTIKEYMETAEQKTAEWEYTDAYPHWVCCGKCHKKFLPNREWVDLYNIPINFCPNCGAKMAEPTNAEKTAEVRPMQVELEADGYADGELVYDYGRCPKCGWEFEEDDKDWEEPYCCHCGQKLKWFESEK